MDSFFGANVRHMTPENAFTVLSWNAFGRLFILMLLFLFEYDITEIGIFLLEKS